ncbi:HPP family protein [Simkania sp.]|uniref:CBS domain-containing protein n=1 Tax=Simkania sp. TaxID=34094 RepID=UPI003B52FA6E
MFYITNTSSARSPYRVEPIDKDRREQQRQPGQQFGGESDAEKHEKFLKASEKLYKQRSVIVAGEIMNKKILPLHENLSLEEAWKLVKDHQFEHFPIVSSEGKLVGLLSEKEILRKIQAKEGSKSLKELVSKETLCADESTNLNEVIQVFFDENLDAVPIIDDEHKVLGILSKNELLQTMIKVSHLRP